MDAENITQDTDQGKKEISFTIITSTNPVRISKGYALDQAGQLVKLPGGAMSQGFAEQINAPFADIGKFLTALNPAQALTYGIADHVKAKVVTAKSLATTTDNGGTPTIARDRKHFHYSEAASLLMLDHDPGKNDRPLTANEFAAKIYTVCPEIRSAPHVITSSASSFIYNKDECLKGPGGWRMLVSVKKGTDITRSGTILFKQAWLKDLGSIFISKSGSALPRAIIDAAVWQPERLDFAGGAYLQAPLEQRRPDPWVLNPDADPLDTMACLPNLTADQENEFIRKKDAAIKVAKPEAEATREIWLDTEVEKVCTADPDKDPAKVRETFKAAAKHKILYGDFVVYHVGEPVTIGEILDNPDKWHGKRFADPLEPDYGNDGRIAWVNLHAAGRSYIYSHAHGGLRYTLHRARQTIRLIAGERYAIVMKTLDVMDAHGQHFVRGNELVTVSQTGAVMPQDKDGILFGLDGLGRWVTFDKKMEDWKSCDCKASISTGVKAARGFWPFKKLAGIATAPIMDLHSGRIIDQDGFDQATGLMMILNEKLEWPGVKDKPTIKDLENAVDTIWKPFKKFPFDGAISRGVMLQAVLTAAVRPMMNTAPGTAFDAPAAGSGKSLLAKSLSEIAGDTPAVLPDAKDGEEIRKRLLSVLRENKRVLLFDNVNGSLESSALCAMLTSEIYCDRILGVSEMVEVPTRTLVLITGNNIQLRGDLCRRILTARIDPNDETPWTRTFDFDPADYCREHRFELVAAALTIIRCGMQSGPEIQGRTASFELWSDTIRRAVCMVGEYKFLGVKDPIESINVAFALDPETQKLAALLEAWSTAFDKDAQTVAEVIVEATERGQTGNILKPDLHGALDEIAGERGNINSRRLGRWIERQRGRIVNSLRLMPAGEYRHAKKWRVVSSF